MISPIDMRRIIIEQSKRAGLGHIGSALSVVEILAAVYGGILQAEGPRDPGRDRFVLSKGHAVLGLYAALHLRGWLTREQLDTYGTDGSWLGMHPSHELPGIDFSTGSLGHGLSLGAGGALAARLQQSRRRTFVLVSDAECNAGSLWEAVMFAAHHRLSNLVALVDLNGQQALGKTDEILSLSPLADRFRAFGWDTHEVDGHDAASMTRVTDRLDTTSGPPHVLVCRTVFGKGISFMEGQLRWHYYPLAEPEYRRALGELG